MHVAPLWPLIAPVASGGAFDVAQARRECRENRIEMRDLLLVATDHQTIAAFEAPDAAAGADIEVMNAFLFQLARAAHIVLVKGVAAVDQHIPGLQRTAELRHRVL